MTGSRSEELRRDFDQSFARPLATAGAPVVDLIGIGIGGDRHALRLSDLAGMYVDRGITPLPGRARALLGIAGFRGAIVPVFDLASLLGYPAASAARWLALATPQRPADHVEEPIAFAFETFTGHLRVTSGAFAPRSSVATPRYVREIVEAEARTWSVVDVFALCDALVRAESREREG